MPIPWDTSLLTGHPSVDADHERLVLLYNKFEEAVTAGKKKEVVEALLVELADYTMSHFNPEERAMVRHNFPEYRAHKAQHDGLLNRLSELIGDLENDSSEIVDETLVFLRNWITDHVMTWDRTFANFVRGADHQLDPPPATRLAQGD